MHSRGDDFFKITCLGACHCYSPLPAASSSSVGGGGVSALLCKPSHSSDLDKGSVPIVGGCLPYLSVIMPCGFDRRLRWTVLWCKCIFGRIVLLTVGCICPNNELPQHSIKFLYCTSLYHGARQFFFEYQVWHYRHGITGMHASLACPGRHDIPNLSLHVTGMISQLCHQRHDLTGMPRRARHHRHGFGTLIHHNWALVTQLV